jgi:LysM repeat protein
MNRLLSTALFVLLAFSAYGQNVSSQASPTPIVTSTKSKVTSDSEKDVRPRVDQVIERAEDHFRKGKSNLEDNKREQARDEFDKAIDEVLMSGLDVSSNWRLRTFYFALVERIYKEEARVIKPNEQLGFRQQRFEPSPLDGLSKLVLAEDEKRVPDGQLSVDTASLTKVRARKGDTIAKIAAARNLSADKLARLNGIAADAELAAGHEIKLPGGTSGALGTTMSQSARDEYIKTTKEYKSSLEKLLLLYQASQTKAEERLATAKTQFANGLVQKEELEANERAVADARTKVDGVRQQIADADKQIDRTLNELREQRSLLLRSKQVEDSLLGSKPTQLANGTVPIIMKWFQGNLHDPYSARYVHWSKIERSSFANGPCWEVTVRPRAKNAFGAYVLSDNTFCVRRNRIVYYQKD